MKYGIDNIKDNRSVGRARKDFDNARLNEEMVILALVAYKVAHGAKIGSLGYEKIDDFEKFADGRVHLNPDYYFSDFHYTVTLEIKVTPLDITHVYFKPSAIYSMINRKHQFPNGYGMIARNRDFAFKSVDKIIKYPLEVVEKWSNEAATKKAFIIPVEEFSWQTWITPINLWHR